MIRAFAALALPEAVRFELMLLQQGLPVPRPVPPENLHLTLVFLGEIAGAAARGRRSRLPRGSRAPGFELALAGLGLFGGARPRVVYVGAAENPALRHLQAKVETAARGAGVALPARRFVPHVTLARLPERLAGRARLEAAVAARGGYAAPRFAVEDFRLYRSHLGGVGRDLRGAGALPARLSGSARPKAAPRPRAVATSARVMPMSRSRWSSSWPSCVPRAMAGIGGGEEAEHAAHRQARPERADRRRARSWWTWSSPSSKLDSFTVVASPCLICSAASDVCENEYLCCINHQGW